ncbi:helix-turn-helix transcriptional regulator [Actinophytocola algeriensis]|uniref:Putative DNA-binding transcriptional regulator YafY n=1 Tax=Actinophytocola algeriensis TaxID=1768010 RepID=A0A7W7VJH1_9PSEU|nr:YafY family protein [Actinophytocola algeriensis]MBB4912508.1 putative DNA-binding transcriptional regulator YafY [Actinophytocola algeriensis]MBE1478882.1 putative DNA-binding transcriptional regulator YafY [Actinophytocola algeriensis]
MNRTDRLYGIVEELRAAAPLRRSARQLAARYEVSTRTIERDISALQQVGVPIYADTGRRGGYAIDPARTLPPLNFTPAEAVAMSVALRQAGGSPFTRAAGSALRKILAAMPDHEASAARELAGRIGFLDPAEPPPIPLVIEDALAARHVLALDYVDKHGAPSERVVEPVMFLAREEYWYLVAWCRLRDELRAFRLDRVVAVRDTGEVVPPRPTENLRLPCHVTQVTTFA